MDIVQFNKKYEKHLETGHYGLDILDEDVINYLDKEFEKMIKFDPDFEFSQIKLKFGMARVYTNNNYASDIWEKQIDFILLYKKEKEKKPNST